jgi:alpha-L-fucosidase
MIYQPTLASVKTHPLPAWFDDAKFGIFIHWGVYSVPAFAPSGELLVEEFLRGESDFARSPYAEWYQNSLRIEGSPTYRHHVQTYGADFRYEQFAEQFNADFRQWEPDAWAELFAHAGARYVVLVTKHHDGFLLWDSRTPNPHLAGWQTSRDVAGELSRALRAKGLKMGVYYSSLLDWTFTSEPLTSPAQVLTGSDTSRSYGDYVAKHWLELIERYDPWILWSDIGYPPGYDLAGLFAHFYNRQPEGLVNDRWLQLPEAYFGAEGQASLEALIQRMKRGEMPDIPHCDFVTPEYATLDHITPHKWETSRGIGSSYGYNQIEDARDYQKAEQLIRLLADVVSKNGNLLLNVGPCSGGAIHPLQVAALAGLGQWLKANGEAIYGTRPWLRHKDAAGHGGEVRYTSKGAVRYAIVVRVPADKVLALPADLAGRASLLGSGASLLVERSGETVRIALPAEASKEAIPVVRIE